MKLMRNQKKKISPFQAAILLVTALLLAGCGKKDAGDTSAASQETSVAAENQSQAIDNTIEWKGKKYTYNNNLQNILFLGVDKSDPIDTEYAPGDAGQADCIMLLSLDTETKEGRILQINRNTMTQIDLYDANGNRLDEMEAQLCLQFATCTGGNNSCYAMKKTVGELLYGLSIDGYFAMDLGGVNEINDALGGVDVVMKKDYTGIEPAFIEGETVHLSGNLTERFVRYRDTTEFNSVQDRMERQVDYITALIGQMNSSGGKKLYDVLSPYLDTYVLTDLDADQMNALTKYTYLTDEIAYLPGEMEMGDEYEEYYVDADALQDLLIRTFYTEVE